MCASQCQSPLTFITGGLPHTVDSLFILTNSFISLQLLELGLKTFQLFVPTQDNICFRYVENALSDVVKYARV